MQKIIFNKSLAFIFCLVTICFISIQEAKSTHIRAGEIIATRISAVSLTYRFTLIVYTFDGSPVDNPTATLFFGDGSQATASRTSRQALGNQTSKNTYTFTHVFPAVGRYKITYTEVNRNEGVLNMTQSVDTPFSIETVLLIDPFLGLNSTPQLLLAPIDLACTGQKFTHNPGAFDIDGDSLAYRLTIPKRSPTETVIGYGDPNKVAPIGSQEGGMGIATFAIDAITGNLVWNAPKTPGFYNIAFFVEEWRNGVRIGYVVRDMQIIVIDCNNKRPEMIIPMDICVEAGFNFNQVVTATDPNNDRVTISASSGIISNPPFVAPYVNKATLTTGPQPQAVTASATFSWQTACEHIRKQPYDIVFKVEDSPPPPQTTRLVDEKVWRITVVGPKPTGLVAVASGRNSILNWNTYSCANASEIIIWRREGCYTWNPMNCELGLPTYTGYVEIARVSGNTITYTDTNGGNGLKKGLLYSYRISAVFPAPAGGASYASDEVCLGPLLDIPIMTKVSVLSTNTSTGQIRVEWLTPSQINTAIYPPPYRYDLYRGEGLNVSNPVLINTQTDVTGTLTTPFGFTDLNLNTTDKTYSYRIAMFTGAGAVFKDSSEIASMVRLTTSSAPSSVKLVWNYNVPWSNANQQHNVYRNINGTFTKIGVASVGNGQAEFFDRGTFNNQKLVVNQTYCYYVETVGTYSNPAIPINPLLNNSQEACGIPIDVTAPCPPVIAVDSIDCVLFDINAPRQNLVTWKKVVNNSGCDDDIAFYKLFYSPSDPGEMVLIANTPSLSFIHSNLTSLAGCYTVTATDFAGNESAVSNMACKDNCIQYRLPNVLTPNNDGKNDIFRPYPDYKFVESVKFEVFDRWGTKVFTSNEIELGWDGKGNAGELAAGQYFYSAEVKFTTLRPEDSIKIYKGWIVIVK